MKLIFFFQNYLCTQGICYIEPRDENPCVLHLRKTKAQISSANQRLCFRYIDSTIPLLSKSNFKPLAIFCDCTVWFVSDFVGNPEDRFSHNETRIDTYHSLKVHFNRPYPYRSIRIFGKLKIVSVEGFRFGFVFPHKNTIFWILQNKAPCVC